MQDGLRARERMPRKRRPVYVPQVEIETRAQDELNSNSMRTTKGAASVIVDFPPFPATLRPPPSVEKLLLHPVTAVRVHEQIPN